MKTLLIHGYGSRINSREIKNNLVVGGFDAYCEEITSKQAQVFLWGDPCKWRWYQIINPLTQIGLYEKEKILATSKKVQNQLSKIIQDQKPSKLIAHSMGGLVLHEYFQNHRPNPELEQIVLLSSDLSQLQIGELSKTVEACLNIKIINYYCPWDQALISSLFLNRYKPAGLLGSKHKNVVSVFHPLVYGPNLHRSFLKDKQLKQKILTQKG